MRETEHIVYDPYTPERWPDPIPAYQSLIRDYPVYYLAKRDMWIISRYEDIVRATKDWETFSSGRGGNILFDKEFPGRVGKTLGASDPPKHTQLRRIVGEVFTPRFVAGLEEDMRHIVRDLISEFRDRRSFDAQWEFAYPYTARVIGVMIGVPEKEMAHFVDLLNAQITVTPEMKEKPGYLVGLLKQMADYCTDLVVKKQKEPAQDIISKLILSEVDGRKLSIEEVSILAITLVSAAFQSAGMAIGCSLSTISKHPEQLAEVCDNHALIPALVEETLRYDGTTIGFVRTTTREVELHGQVIPEGARVFLCYAAANHDPDRFPNPERFDIHRQDNKHLGFGYGIHTCLGAPMARLMMRIAFEELLPVLGNRFEVQYDRSELARTVQFRGYNILPVAYESP